MDSFPLVYRPWRRGWWPITLAQFERTEFLLADASAANCTADIHGMPFSYFYREVVRQTGEEDKRERRKEGGHVVYDVCLEL